MLSTGTKAERVHVWEARTSTYPAPFHSPIDLSKLSRFSEASLIAQPCVKDFRLSFLNLILFQGLTKTIPSSPPGQPPIHDVANPIFKGAQK